MRVCGGVCEKKAQRKIETEREKRERETER